MIAIKDDPLFEKYAKYIKMKKMNIPPDAILQKLKTDGIPESHIEILDLDVNEPLPIKFRGKLQRRSFGACSKSCHHVPNPGNISSYFILEGPALATPGTLPPPGIPARYCDKSLHCIT